MSVKPMFPDFIYTANLDIPPSYTTDLIAEAQHLLQHCRHSLTESGKTTYFDDVPLHKLPLFKPLVNEINKHANIFIRKIAENPVQIAMDCCWVTISQDGNFHSKHVHINNIISGVFYVTVPQQHSTLNFFNTNKSSVVKAIMEEPIVQNKLIMFEGHVPHSFDPIPCGDQKIAIAFNCNEVPLY
jgi:uncharacterized protein (TIGR02466 family)